MSLLLLFRPHTSDVPTPPDEIVPIITVGGSVRTKPKRRPEKPPTRQLVTGAADADLGTLTAHMTGFVTFSTLDDEDELLLVLT